MDSSVWVWLTPTLMALVFWGLGQGFVKKYISEVPPARFCLYFVVAKSIVNLWYFSTNEHLPPFAPEGMRFFLVALLAYVMDGIGWILYFQSIVYGPISIVGTLSAAYPAITIVLARIFLAEMLTPVQYVGVSLVMLCCLGLAYEPSDPESKETQGRWIPLAVSAVLVWGVAWTVMKYAYSLPNAGEANMALFNTMGSFLTLGIYGLLYGRKGVHSLREWSISFLPMGLMAAGDLSVIIAAKTGPVSIVAPLSGAYPVVTLGFAWMVLKERITKFQWLCIAFLLVGMFLSPGGG